MPDDDWDWRYFPAYRLKKADLQKLLDSFFSPDEPMQYFIEVFDLSLVLLAVLSLRWLTSDLAADRSR